MDEIPDAKLVELHQRLAKLWIAVVVAGRPRGLEKDITRMNARLSRERKRRGVK